MKGNLLKRLTGNKELILLSLPSVLFIILFNYLPLYGLILPFKNYKYNLGFFKSPWAGFTNFKFLFNSDDVLHATRNTILYNAAFIIIGTVVTVATALMLFELGKKYVKIYQSIMFFPYFLSWVLVSYVFMSLLDVDNGIINRIIMNLGGQQIMWYSDPKFWPFILVFASLWKGLGYGCVIYYAAMMGFNPEYYEAAILDGASRFQQAIHISIPLLKPLIIMLTILSIGRIFYSDFGLFYYVPRDSSLVYSTTSVLDTYVYRILRTGDLGMSSAAGFYQSVAGFFLVLGSNFVLRKVDPDNALF